MSLKTYKKIGIFALFWTFLLFLSNNLESRWKRVFSVWFHSFYYYMLKYLVPETMLASDESSSQPAYSRGPTGAVIPPPSASLHIPTGIPPSMPSQMQQQYHQPPPHGMLVYKWRNFSQKNVFSSSMRKNCFQKILTHFTHLTHNSFLNLAAFTFCSFIYLILDSSKNGIFKYLSELFQAIRRLLVVMVICHRHKCISSIQVTISSSLEVVEVAVMIFIMNQTRLPSFLQLLRWFLRFSVKNCLEFEV